ncbi:MAG: hypothetical protein ACLGIJ_06430 [Candidatus Limnocylindria bacterium]
MASNLDIVSASDGTTIRTRHWPAAASDGAPWAARAGRGPADAIGVD